MSKSISIFITLFITIILTGCGTKGLYHEEYISKDIKPNLNKVTNTEVCLASYNNEFITRRMSHPLPDNEITLKAGEINYKILNEYTKQYFNQTSSSCNNTSLKIDSHIKDFKYDFNFFGKGTVFITLNIKVSKGEKLILDKNYFIEKDNKIITNFFSITQKSTDNIIELYHRSLLNFYETDFKKDLLEVL
ncbi:hypothetical protein [Sulfurospirillum sp. MES]|uniref:hypothetical protein n=1 Tax=Sulfurospirillum sp. MES TaxID=1565314 RepID=UPI00054412A7|nr:hypothetical protein [Sulfurospirillum sp. MES]KHG33013.1 MAG: hypothetical protein OA34_12120 [Sulfurospirillum sp. MES]